MLEFQGDIVDLEFNRKQLEELADGIITDLDSCIEDYGEDKVREVLEQIQDMRGSRESARWFWILAENRELKIPTSGDMQKFRDKYNIKR